VWYSGLFISGIAVDELTGDVYFSDAAGNRVVRQSANGSVLAVYRFGFRSPSQLAYYDQRLYVADSTNNRAGWIDVASGSVTWSPPPELLTTCSALSLSPRASLLYVVDSTGLMLQVLDVASNTWIDGMSVPLSNLQYPLRYAASVSTLPALYAGDPYLADPLTSTMYRVTITRENKQPYYAFDLSSTPGVSAIQQYPNQHTNYTVYVLSQPAADEPMTVTLYNRSGHIINQTQAPGRGGGAVPFYGRALYVDSSRSMYISDHGVDESSPHGRVVKLAPNGTELGEWSMSDGVAYSFTSVVYDDSGASGGSCALWMTDTERGLVRVAADGTVMPSAQPAPTDPADNRTARFSAISLDQSSQPPKWDNKNSTFVLLDTSNPSTTKVWSFRMYDQYYSLLNTTAARLSPNLTAVVSDVRPGNKYLVDSRTHSIIRIKPTGELDAQFNTTQKGLVEPAGMAFELPWYQRMYVADSGWGGTGAVLVLNVANLSQPLSVLPQSSPAMHRPLSVAFDWYSFKSSLYVADSNGLVFEYDLTTTPAKQRYWYQPVPATKHIVSMQVSDIGDVYLLDAYSRRLIVMKDQEKTRRQPGDDCLLPTSSSSSSSSPPSAHHAVSSSSSSSTGMVVQPSAATSWPVDAILVAVGVLALLTVVGGASWMYMKRRSTNSRSGGRGSTSMGERLMAGQERQEEAKWAEERAGVMPARGNHDSDAGSELAYVAAPHAATMRWPVADGSVQPPPNRTARYDYYVAQYEVLAAVNGTQDGLEAVSSSRAPLSRASSLTSVISTSSSSDYSTASTDSNPSSAASSFTPPFSDILHLTPRHIPRLESAWQSVPHFIDAVSDLTILGEGSSGLVYSGVYDGIACVVKLPKSAALTGAAWREWQCHLRLPPHRHVVRFLGALPMSSTNYLVTAFVRQGSLHSLLRSPRSWYSRPYAVMRCVRDMCAALQHIHSAGIVHRDVSCRNILVDSDGRMVLADLGLATQLKAADDSTRPSQHMASDSLQTAVPVRWTSPEALAASQYSSQSDVWSLGVALWEMTANGRLPYGEQQANTKPCIRPIIAQQLTLHVDEQWGSDSSIGRAEQQLAGTVRRVIQLCLTYEVEQRPDSAQLAQQVEQWWQEWRAEARHELADIERQWYDYHEQVQQRLGPPVPEGT